MGFPGGFAVKNPPASAGDAGSTLDQEDPLEKEIATHSRILAAEFHGQRSLAGAVHRVTKSGTKLSN